MSNAFPQAPRKVLARPRQGGLLSKGNHFSSNTGRTTQVPTNFVPRNSGYYGDNSALKDESVYRGPITRKPQLKRGRVCPGCGIEKPLSGQCQQCW